MVVRKHAIAVFEAIRAPVQAPPQSVRNLGFGCFPNRWIPSNRYESKKGVQKAVGSRSQARSIAEIGGRFSVHRVDPSGPDKVGSKSSLLYRLRQSRESFRGLGFSSITRALPVFRLRQHQRKPTVSGVGVREVGASLARRVEFANHRTALYRAVRVQRHQTSHIPWRFFGDNPRPVIHVTLVRFASKFRTWNWLRSSECVVKRSPVQGGSHRKVKIHQLLIELIRKGQSPARVNQKAAISTCKSSV